MGMYKKGGWSCMGLENECCGTLGPDHGASFCGQVGFVASQMRFSLLLAMAAAQAVIARDDDGCDAPGPDADGRYTISAPGIKAQVCGIE